MQDDPVARFELRLAYERAVLGCMILKPSCIPDARRFLAHFEFGAHRHQVMFDAICHWSETAGDASFIKWDDLLHGHGLVDNPLAVQLYLDCMESVPDKACPELYAERLAAWEGEGIAP